MPGGRSQETSPGQFASAAWRRSSWPRTGRPARITREAIVQAARRIVDGEGLDRLTMRRLADEVGTTPMALYHHVRNKDDLLVLLLEASPSRCRGRAYRPIRANGS